MSAMLDARIHDAFVAPAGPTHGAMPHGMRRQLWAQLLDCADDPQAAHVQALAGVLATAFEQHGLRRLPLVGLDAAATRRLLDGWFAGADRALGLDWPALHGAHRAEPRADEIEDLVALLVEAPAPALADPEQIRWVAHALAQGTLGDDHLWQDLHLPSRRALGALLQRWFPAIAARNDRDMKWKKFLYKQLCERAELSICRAPSCSVCTDYARCFGPEDAPLAPRP